MHKAASKILLVVPATLQGLILMLYQLSNNLYFFKEDFKATKVLAAKKFYDKKFGNDAPQIV